MSSLFIFLSLVSAATLPSLLEEGSHCVAYRAQKTMFLVKKSEVVGKNCDIAAQVLPELGGLYHIEVNIPVRSFNSGDVDRDKDVLKILKAEARPELTFRSKALSASAWQELFAQKEFSLTGDFLLGDKSYPLTLQVRYLDKNEIAEVDGMGKIRFQDFEISPPKVGGGVVAKAKPDLELHFHLLSSRILGIDAIRLPKAKP